MLQSTELEDNFQQLKIVFVLLYLKTPCLKRRLANLKFQTHILCYKDISYTGCFTRDDGFPVKIRPCVWFAAGWWWKSLDIISQEDLCLGHKEPTSAMLDILLELESQVILSWNKKAYDLWNRHREDSIVLISNPEGRDPNTSLGGRYKVLCSL